MKQHVATCLTLSIIYTSILTVKSANPFNEQCSADPTLTCQAPDSNAFDEQCSVNPPQTCECDAHAETPVETEEIPESALIVKVLEFLGQNGVNFLEPKYDWISAIMDRHWALKTEGISEDTSAAELAMELGKGLEAENDLEFNAAFEANMADNEGLLAELQAKLKELEAVEVAMKKTVENIAEEERKNSVEEATEETIEKEADIEEKPADTTVETDSKDEL